MGSEREKLKADILAMKMRSTSGLPGVYEAGWNRAVEAVVSLPFFASPPAESAEREPDAECECALWATDMLVSGHHYRCEKFNPRPFIEAIHGLLDGMEQWAADEDGVHPDAWKAYKRGCELVCRTVMDSDEVAPASPAAEEGEAGKELPPPSVRCKLYYLWAREPSDNPDYKCGGMFWFVRCCGMKWQKLGEFTFYDSSELIDVDRNYSLRDALALYDRETAQREEGV